MTSTCQITGKKDCRDRNCELHYMDAPVRLAPSRRPAPAITAFIVYASSIPLANILIENYGPVPVGFSLLAPAGVFAAGLAFTARDLLQRWAGKAWSLAAIVAGVLLSLLLADPRLALASAVAFGLSELMDMAAYTALARRTFTGAVLISNALGLVVDSIVFLSLAFGSLAFLPGQIVGKAWMTLAALVILIPVRMRTRAA